MKAIKNILKDEVLYQTYFPRRRNLFVRHNYARGVTIEGYADIAFLPYGQSEGSSKFDKRLVFLACVDAMSKKLWTDCIPEDKVSPQTVEASFRRLFKKGG